MHACNRLAGRRSFAHQLGLGAAGRGAYEPGYLAGRLGRTSAPARIRGNFLAWPRGDSIQWFVHQVFDSKPTQGEGAGTSRARRRARQDRCVPSFERSIELPVMPLDEPMLLSEPALQESWICRGWPRRRRSRCFFATCNAPPRGLLSLENCIPGLAHTSTSVTLKDTAHVIAFVSWRVNVRLKSIAAPSRAS